MYKCKLNDWDSLIAYMAECATRYNALPTPKNYLPRRAYDDEQIWEPGADREGYAHMFLAYLFRECQGVIKMRQNCMYTLQLLRKFGINSPLGYGKTWKLLTVDLNARSCY